VLAQALLDRTERRRQLVWDALDPASRSSHGLAYANRHPLSAMVEKDLSSQLTAALLV